MGSSDFDLVPRRFLDDDLSHYTFNKEFEKKQEEQNNGKQFFDNTLSLQAGVSNLASPVPMMSNRRSYTWNIPRLDLVWRSSPYVKRAVDWISSKLLIKGIDINTQEESVTTKELNLTQQEFKNLYRPLQKMAESALVYGGGANLIIIKDRQSAEDYMKPLIIGDIKKGEFLGLKPLARWYQIEPAIDQPLVTQIGEEHGITEADLLGQPMYYRVNLSGGLGGFSGLNGKGVMQQGRPILVHRSWLLIFNPYSLSHIETQVERYWSQSIIEVASVDLERHEIIWSATTKSAVKNNIGIVSIDGFESTLANEYSKKIVNEKIELMKYTTNHGLITLGSKDTFSFAQSSLAGNEKAIEQSMKQISTAFDVPVSVMFKDNAKFDEESYLQSLYGVENMQEKELRPSINKLIKIVYKSLFGKKIKSFDFEFKPIVTMTQKQKAEVMKIMGEVLSMAHEDGAIPTKDYIRMLGDLGNNPSNIFHQISEDYIDEILKGDEDGKTITSNTFKIELAKALNQFQQEQNGISGVEHPESASGGKSTGGDPTKSKGLFKRNTLNPNKGKE